jgi:hypothetical protein
VDRVGFREYLAERKVTKESIERARRGGKVRVLRTGDAGHLGEPSTNRHRKGVCVQADGAATDTYDDYLALARFGQFMGNQAVFVTMLEILDGHEALGNLRREIADELGETAD